MSTLAQRPADAPHGSSAVRPRMASTYARKITTNLAFLRPVTVPTRIMRIGGLVRGGAEEISSLGPFQRWDGVFTALCSRQSGPTDQVGRLVVEATSYHLILPGLVADWLTSFFDAEQRDLGKRAPDETRTGVFYVPKPGLDEVEFVIDLLITPPKSSAKPSTTGYEFQFDILRQDARHNPMAALQGRMDGLPAFLPSDDTGQPALPLEGPSAGATALPGSVSADETDAGAGPDEESDLDDELPEHLRGPSRGRPRPPRGNRPHAA